MNTGVDPQTLLELPSLTGVEVAVHPNQNWGAVASVWGEPQGGTNNGPLRHVWVRVFDPKGLTRSLAQQVNPVTLQDGDARYGGVALAITGDGTVHVAWGGAFTPGQPVWYAQSHDSGRTWSAPLQIGHDCYHAARLAATPDGQLVLLALCSPRDSSVVQPGFIVRRADGSWLPQTVLPVDGRWGSVEVIGDGADVQAVALVGSATGHGGTIVEKRLSAPDPWQVHAIDLSPPAGLVPASATAYVFRSLHYHRPTTNQDGIIFTWSTYGANSILAVESVDGGQHWGPVSAVVGYPSGVTTVLDHRWSAPAYDARADRVVVLWVARNFHVPWPGDGTHYASWSMPGTGHWQPTQGPEQYAPVIPLVTGATSAGETATGQSGNSSSFWLAWLNAGHQLQARTLDLDLIVPASQYPTATSAPTLVPTAALPGGG